MGNRYKELAEKAYTENKVNELLCGTDGFSTGTEYLPANVSTDINGIFESGIYKICNTESVMTVKDKIKESILSLSHGSPEEIWCAYNACWAQLYFEKKGKAPFTIFDEEMILLVRTCFLEHKNKLNYYQKKCGLSNADGVWRELLDIKW